MAKGTEALPRHANMRALVVRSSGCAITSYNAAGVFIFRVR